MDNIDGENINNINSENDEGIIIGKGAEEWLDKHSKPSFAYLYSLVNDGNPKAIETLKEIADQHDVAYTTETDLNELVDKIRFTIERE